MKWTILLCVIFAVAVVNGHAGDPGLYFQNAKWELDAAVSITATPSKIAANGDWVEVHFSGVTEPKDTDIIAVYTPSTVNPEHTASVKYQKADKSADYLKKGSGSLKFQLVNMFADYAFVLVHDNKYVAKSNPVTFANENVPLQGHLSLTKNLREMRISWATKGDSKDQYVRWGTSPGNYTFSKPANATTYTAKELCGSPANAFGWREPGYMQTAIMDNLTPSTEYYYVYGGQSTGWSPESSFKSAPVPSSSTPVNVILYGDMGRHELDGSDEHWRSPGAYSTTENVIKNLPGTQLILHIGDISYAVGYSAQWDSFMNQIMPIATKVPYMTGIGNHERDFPNSGSMWNGTDSGGECGVPYYTRFHLPTEHDKPWYSINWGNVHFVIMSTEHNFKKGSEQHAWIEKDLSSVDRKVTPWVVFTGHRPMYTTDGGEVAELLQKELEEYLVKYKVDLALWGHVHNYQRTCPVEKKKCHKEGYPVHSVIGMAGFRFSEIKKHPDYFVKTDNKNYGFSRITTTSDSLHFAFYGNGVKDPIDEFTLKK